MNIPTKFYVTPFYKDPIQNEKDMAPLEYYAALAYDLASRGKLTECAAILERWSLTCTAVENSEAEFSLIFWGQLFLEAYLKLDPKSWNSGVFRPWVEYLYKKCAFNFYNKTNNQGSWGILGAVLSDLVLGNSVKSHQIRLTEHIQDNVTNSGIMKYEVKRTNSGMWYSYFSLAPMLRSSQLLDVVTILMKPLAWLFQYCLEPKTWPYKLKPWPLREIQKKIYPCADRVELPSPRNWPGNLYFEAGKYFDVPEWSNWAKPPFYTNIFRVN